VSHHHRFPSSSIEYSSSFHSSSITKSGSLMHMPLTSAARPTSPDYNPEMFRATRVRSVSSDLRSLILPAKIPPPKEFALKKASRNKDGFFINVKDKKDCQDSVTSSELSSTEDDKIQHAMSNENGDFAPREAKLKRTAGVKKSSSQLNNKRLMILRKEPDSSSPQSLPSQDPTNSNFSYNDAMTRSLRYKKIDLRPPEKPLYTDSVNTDSEEEGDSERNSRYSSASSVPGPSAGGGRGDSSDAGTLDVSIDSQLDDSFNQSAGSKSGDEVTLRYGSSPSSNSTATKDVLGRFKFFRQSPSSSSSSHKKAATTSYQPAGHHSLANTYSRVTVLGTKEDASAVVDHDFTIPEHKIRQRTRSNSQPTLVLFRCNLSNFENDGDMEAIDLKNSLKSIKNTWNLDSELSTSLPLEADMISPSNLPSRPTSEMFNDFSSQNSVEDLVIPPPAVFCSGKDQEESGDLHQTSFQLDSPRVVKDTLSPTQNAKTELFLEGPSESSVKADKKAATSSEGNAASSLNSDHQKDLRFLPESEVNRNSTDSNDTGYTSTSPGYQSTIHSQLQRKSLKSHDQILEVDVEDASKPTQVQQMKTPVKDLYGSFPECGHDDFSAGISPEGRSTPVMEAQHNNEPRVSGAVGGAMQSYSSSHSLASICSDMSRMYVPLVFYSPRPLGNVGVSRRDPNLFCIQVCLIENSEDLVKVCLSLIELIAIIALTSNVRCSCYACINCLPSLPLPPPPPHAGGSRHEISGVVHSGRDGGSGGRRRCGHICCGRLHRGDVPGRP